ncbi:MAG: neutral zinc metallopeptidase [Candidatus Gracilibacteria bacterium]|nr:neutral zinc metallopeptidase [Candidatus Gracilibacteria bacterium]
MGNSANNSGDYNINHQKIKVLLTQKDLRNKTRKNLNPENPENNILNKNDFEAFINEQIDIIGSIWKEILKSIGKDYSTPKIVFFENSIHVGNEEFDGEICYDPNNNTIVIKKGTISFFQNSKLGVLGAIAHEVGHSIQVQLNIYNSLTESLAESYADLIIGYTFKVMVNKGLFDEQDIHEICFIMADFGDDCEFISLVKGEKNIHGDGNERMSNIYKGYSSEETDITSTFDMQEILKIRLTNTGNNTNKEVMDILGF